MKKQAKSKATVSASDDSQHQTRVLLEEMNQGIKTIGEQHGSIVRSLDGIESELKSVKMAVMGVDARVSRVEKKLDTTITQNEERFKRIEDKLQIA